MIFKSSRLTFFSFVALTCASVLLVGEALACFSPGPTFEPDPDAAKIVIGKPQLEVTKIERGGKIEGRTGTCDTYGKLVIKVSPSLSNVGYEFVIVEDEEANNPPDGFEFPKQIQLPPSDDGTFMIHWDDGLKTPQEPFKFKMKVKTYAPDGTAGPESEPILVTHPGG